MNQRFFGAAKQGRYPVFSVKAELLCPPSDAKINHKKKQQRGSGQQHQLKKLNARKQVLVKGIGKTYKYDEQNNRLIKV